MSKTGSIQVAGLGKFYKRYTSRWTRLVEWLDPDEASRHEKHWVLRDVDFNIRAGESVGIIGHNGAGKSTLLKIISGTTLASTGTVEVQGRVAALLELGMGFHPDFTGRQNAYMSGQLLGFSNDEIAALMPGIEDFAEIGDYMDQPLRTYSSGMQVRLAFSVATAVRPDILIVDEALSVGDAYFQHKSFDRIRKFRDDGTTLLFVSHSPSSIKTLCSRAILIDRGTILRDDAPDAVLDYYNAIIARREAEHAIRVEESETGSRITRSGSQEANIIGIELLDSKGQSARALRSCESAQIVLDVQVCRLLPQLTAGILIRDALGNDVFGTNSFHHAQVIVEPKADSRYRLHFNIESLTLGRGSYSISVALHSHDTHVVNNYDWWDRAIVFQIVPGERMFSVGVCSLLVDIQVERLVSGDGATT